MFLLHNIKFLYLLSTCQNGIQTNNTQISMGIIIQYFRTIMAYNELNKDLKEMSIIKNKKSHMMFVYN